MNKEEIVELLKKRTTSEKNINIFLKYLLHIEKQAQIDYIGMILDTEIPLKDILSDLKEGKVGYELCAYKDLKEKKDMEYIRETEPSEVVEGLHKCYKCKNKKVSTYSVQLRSADEPMTHFFTCIVCGNKWKG